MTSAILIGLLILATIAVPLLASILAVNTIAWLIRLLRSLL